MEQTKGYKSTKIPYGIIISVILIIFSVYRIYRSIERSNRRDRQQKEYQEKYNQMIEEQNQYLKDDNTMDMRKYNDDN